MTRHLTFWAAVATAAALALGLFAIGLQPAVLIALAQVPALLCGLLVLRAAVLLLRRRPLDLVWRDRSILPGRSGLFVPLLLLAAWLLVREIGVLDANLSWTQWNHRTSWHSSAWRELPADAPPSEGRLVVDVPEGAFGAAFRDQIPDAKFVDSARVTGRVATAYQPPYAFLPLYKAATVRTAIQTEVRLEHADGRVMMATIEMEVDGELRMFGLASQRAFHGHLGTAIGRKVHDAIHDHVKKGMQQGTGR